MYRNKEVRLITIVFIFIAIIAIYKEFQINKAAGNIAMISISIIGISFYIFTKLRYRNLAKMAHQIDIVLHNEDHIYIADMEEGELSILQNEIIKMTQRIREQNVGLAKEKQHLADSMADIAHQLRTPLTSVNLILSLLDNNTNERECKSLIRETKGLFMQMDWLLTSLLKVSRIDGGIVVFQSKDVEVKELINKATQSFLLSMELHNIALKVEVEEGIFIKGDFNWLTEAIENIIKNCMQSVEDNGVIKIICNSNPLFVEIIICDNGKGFTKEDLPHVFERFYRGKNSSAIGYGIGLALCKMIITGHGGNITAKNHIEGGALFSIRFPK